MGQPDHVFELPPDPHEDWYFAVVYGWRDMDSAERQRAWDDLDPALKAEFARRIRHRRVVAAGMELKKKELEAEAAMWLGAALDDAIQAIANRASLT